MNWLLALRLLDLALIGVSVGFTLALYLHFDSLSTRTYLKLARTLYLFSYISLAVAAMAEIQIAITTESDASWRTAVVTVAALSSVSANVWCWRNWEQIRYEMKAGVP